MRELWKSKRIAIALLIAVGMMLTVGVVYADLKADKNVYAWDIVPNKYSNSNVALPFNVWMPFWHQLDFDVDPFNPATRFPFYSQHDARYIQYSEVSGCAGTGRSTTWEGVMEYGLAHVDNRPLGGHGFVNSRAWELVDCDRDGVYTPTNKVLDNADLAWTPPSGRTTIMTDGQTLSDGRGGWKVLDYNVVVPCTTGNCQSELVTTIFVSLDMNCDGYPDDPRAGIGHTHDAKAPYPIDWPAVCFFAEALSPPLEAPAWEGNLQARVGTGEQGGDKTVNFNVGFGTTPVKLTSFTGRSAEAGSQPVILGAVAAVLGGAAVGALVWRRRPAQL